MDGLAGKRGWKTRFVAGSATVSLESCGVIVVQEIPRALVTIQNYKGRI